MKKILLFLGLLWCIQVYASENVFELSDYLPGIYVQKDLGGGHYFNKYFSKIKKSGTNELVYCLEPGVKIASDSYTSLPGDFHNYLNLSEESWDRIVAFAYFGYGYEGHEEEKWYIATQMLIWQEVSDVPIYFTNTIGGKRIEKYVDEMNEIRSLADKYVLGPSFLNAQVVLGPKDEVVLVDSNNTTDIYKLLSHTGSTITLKEGALTIKYKESGNFSYALESKKGLSKDVIYYFHETGQKLLGRGSLPPKQIGFSVFSLSTSLQIKKIGEKVEYSEEGYSFVPAVLEGASFAIYAKEEVRTQSGKTIYEKGKIVKKVTTNIEGMASVEDLPFGEYCIKELSAPDHVVDPTESCFTLNQEKTSVFIERKNEREKHDFTLLKLDANTKEPLQGAIFALYTLDDIKLFEGKTNEEGILHIANLYQGEFLLKEIQAPEGYQLLEQPQKIKIAKEDVSVVLENKKEIRIIEVPDTYKTDSLLIASFLFFCGLLFLKRKHA